MKWSSIKDFIWESLPLYFHNKDTNTDNPSGGVLKRFLDICSEYFDEEIVPDIDNLPNLWDADTTSPIFLNYLWEYLGYLPYAYGIITTGSHFDKDELSKIDSDYFRNDNCPLPEVDYRRLLKYAISLYKIRCTEKFYTILGKFYGVNITVKDPSENDNPFVDSLGLSGVSPWEGDYDLSGMNYDIKDTDRYDKAALCYGCDTLEATIDIPENLYLSIIENGNIENTKNMILEILNKYLPIQVTPFSLYNNRTKSTTKPNSTAVFRAEYQDYSSTSVNFLII